jgi:chromosomal replication initiator protein
LVQALTAEVAHRRRDAVIGLLAAGDIAPAEQLNLFSAQADTTQATAWAALEEAKHCDVLIIEDLQHLNVRVVESVVQTVDYLAVRQRPLVFTANASLQHLTHRGERFPARLTSRLAAGLVVAMEPLGPESRLTLLQTLAQRRQLAVSTEVLQWLATRLTGGGRQMFGAIAQLEAMLKSLRGQIDLADLEVHFKVQAESGRATAERIAERVSGYFHVEPSELQSHRRHRGILLPRQVGMYLTRKLTDLSLDQIGEYFGGRDHSTVLHACRKVEIALGNDAVLSGAVKEIHASLA